MHDRRSTRPLARRLRGWLACLIALLALAGCNDPNRIEVESAWAPSEVFELGPTFAWTANQAEPKDNFEVPSPALNQFVRERVVAELTSRGYRRALPAEASFLVDYRIGTRWKFQRANNASFTDYEEGSVSLAIVDPRTRRIMWTGSARAKVDPSLEPSERRARITGAVHRLIEDLPRGPG